MKMNSKESFYSKDRPQKIIQFIIRGEFIRNIKKFAPEVEKFLKNKVLPVYNQLLDKDIMKDKSNSKKSHYRDWDYIKHAKKDYYSELVPLKDILNEWSVKYNLFDDWIMESVLKILYFGFNELEWEDTLHTTNSLPFPKEVLRITFRHPGWNVLKLPWRQAKTIIKNDFKKYLEEEYYDKISKLVKVSGMRSPIVKRQTQKHLKWLIDYQFHNDKSYQDICKAESKDLPDSLVLSTIVHGITSTAKLIELTLRK